MRSRWAVGGKVENRAYPRLDADIFLKFSNVVWIGTVAIRLLTFLCSRRCQKPEELPHACTGYNWWNSMSWRPVLPCPVHAQHLLFQCSWSKRSVADPNLPFYWVKNKKHFLAGLLSRFWLWSRHFEAAPAPTIYFRRKMFWLIVKFALFLLVLWIAQKLYGFFNTYK